MAKQLQKDIAQSRKTNTGKNFAGKEGIASASEQYSSGLDEESAKERQRAFDAREAARLFLGLKHG